MYGILIICLKISRYLESYYRYEDILAVNNKQSKTLPILTLFDWVSILANNMKRKLEEHILPPSITYKESLELILNILRADMVNIDNYRLDPDSYQLEDYTMVTDYRIYDGGDQTNPRIALRKWNFDVHSVLLASTTCRIPSKQSILHE